MVSRFLFANTGGLLGKRGHTDNAEIFTSDITVKELKQWSNALVKPVLDGIILIIEENSDVLQSDHSNKWLGFEKILDEYKALKTPSTEKRFQIMEKLSKKCWFTKNASKKKKGTEAAQRAFVQFKRSAKNVSLRVAGKAKIGAKKWRTRAALAAAGEGNDEKTMPKASSRAAGKHPGSLQNLSSPQEPIRSNTLPSKGARASDFSDLKVPAELLGETIVRDHFKADAGMQRDHYNIGLSEYEFERQATDSLTFEGLSPDGSGMKEDVTTSAFVNFPIIGTFQRKCWTKWGIRWYVIHDNGKLEYYKTKAKFLKRNNSNSKPNTTLDFSTQHTISLTNWGKDKALKINIGRQEEIIRIDFKFMTNLVAMYTELKNEAKLEQLHNISNTLRASTNVSGRRRMAQREFSSRRDSPVMTRLLQEIIAAQDN